LTGSYTFRDPFHDPFVAMGFVAALVLTRARTAVVEGTPQ
jgi:hypothetical protein